MKRSESIKKMSPSAARLLLAYLTGTSNDTFDDIVIRAGIGTYNTYIKAKQELTSFGFIDIRGEDLFVHLRDD